MFVTYWKMPEVFYARTRVQDVPDVCTNPEVLFQPGTYKFCYLGIHFFHISAANIQNSKKNKKISPVLVFQKAFFKKYRIQQNWKITLRISSECSFMLSIVAFPEIFFRVLLRDISIFCQFCVFLMLISEDFFKFTGIIFEDIQRLLTGNFIRLWLHKCEFSHSYWKVNFKSQLRDQNLRIYRAEIVSSSRKMASQAKFLTFQNGPLCSKLIFIVSTSPIHLLIEDLLIS